MNKILLFAMLTFVVGYAFGQSATIVDPVNVVEGTLTDEEDEEIEVHWDVVNSSSEELTFRARRIVTDEVAGSENRFCWGPICYGNDTNESSTSDALLVVIPAGGTEDTFAGYYNHEGNSGCTQVTYCFFDHNNEDDETCHAVTFAIDCVVGVEEVVKLDGTLGQISPNPVQGMASFSYQINGQSAASKIVIYNMIGEIVKEIPLNNPQGFVYVNGQEFESGVYFYSLVSNNDVLSTKKMVIGE